MLKQSVLQLKQRFHSLSSLYSASPAIAKTPSSCFDFCQISIKARVKNHSFRRFSTIADSSVETKMDGAGDSKTLNADYEELLKAQEKGVLIIDVREHNEINETGKLPGSIHIPMGDVTITLTSLSDDMFKGIFDKSKPTKDTKIIVSCKSGMRSGKVQQEMQKLGFQNVYNYKGGWLEWESKQKA